MRRFVIAVLALFIAAPAHAEVIAVANGGFVIRQVAEVTASPEDAWKELLNPSDWWDGNHSFSGDAKNLSIDARAGGCFCETLPGDGERGWLHPKGSVEHMRVIVVEQNEVLRMVGALGPLQSEAVQATLTIGLKAIDGGTRITWEYVVGGYMRYTVQQIAPPVDKVIGEQLTMLAEKLGPRAPATNPAPKPGMESGR